MKTTGKVVALTQKIEGQSDNGNFWSKRTLVIEVLSDSPHKLAIEFFGDDKVNMLMSLKEGDIVEVVYFPQCDEYKGKWFTRLSGVRVTRWVTKVP